MVYITQRNGGWLARATWRDPYDLDENGKPIKKQKSKQGFKTKREAKAWGTEYELKGTRGLIQQPKTPKFADYFIKWAETYKIPKIEPRSAERYYALHKQIQKEFGILTMDKITRMRYQEALNKFAANHAQQSVNHYLSITRSCVNAAIQDGVIYKDFTAGIYAKGNKDRKMKIIYPSVSQIQALLKLVTETRNPTQPENYMIITAIATGMRVGEIAGLRWNKIDFTHKTIKIDKAFNYHRIKKTPELLKGLKNDSSYRTIRVNDELLNILKELKPNKNDLNLVFGYPKQPPYVPASKGLNELLREYLSQLKIDLGDFHFHSLRHCHVALLHHLFKQNNLPVDWYSISHRLGHKNLQTTLSIYAYLADEDKKDSDDKFESYLNNFMKK
ncbi:tyrosine-type recombinase/integrase [Lactobacillus sp.]|uniref:site-specific integrase n=1 Tax=Lactobacillus sp. TaxID=1591 RepID=UPI001998E5EB|nr:tyrosine-type recombinase/integrase [Lactobacillus sp.]MBD5430109.1 site-specific integrase [Lactobacillus sp.]